MTVQIETPTDTEISSGREQYASRNSRYASQKVIATAATISQPGCRVKHKDDGAEILHATPCVKRGDERIGRFFQQVREECGYGGDKIYAFGQAMNPPMNGSALQRIEQAERMPGTDALTRIYPFVKQAKLNPRYLLYLWLEAHKLHVYVAEIKSRSRVDDKEREGR